MKVEIKKNEEEVYYLFKKHKAIWLGLFAKQIKGNKAILHFDCDGNLRRAEVPTIIEN